MASTPIPPPFGLDPQLAVRNQLAIAVAPSLSNRASARAACTCTCHCLNAPEPKRKRPLQHQRHPQTPQGSATATSIHSASPVQFSWLQRLGLLGHRTPHLHSQLPSRVEIEIKVQQPQHQHQQPLPASAGRLTSSLLHCLGFSSILSAAMMSAQSVDVHVKVKLVRPKRPELDAPVVNAAAGMSSSLRRDREPLALFLSAPPPPPLPQHASTSNSSLPLPFHAKSSKGKRPPPLAFIPDPPQPLSSPSLESPSAQHRLTQTCRDSCNCPPQKTHSHSRHAQGSCTMPPSSSSRSAVGSTVAKSASRPTRTTANSASSSTSTRAHNHWSDRLLSVLVPLSVLSFVIPAIVSALLHAFSLPATTASSSSNRRHGGESTNKSRASAKSEEHMERYRQLRASHLKRTSTTQNKQQQAGSVPRSWSDPELGLKSPAAGAHPNPGVNASNGSAIPPLCELNKSASCPNLGRYARRSGATSSTSRSRNRSGSAYSGTNAADDTRSVCSSASTDDLDAISESTPFLLSPASSSPQVAKPKTIPPSEASAFHSSSAALHRDSAVFPSPTSSLFSSRSTANESTCADTRGSTSSTAAAAPMIAFNPTPFTPATSHKHTNATTTTAPSSLTTTVASSPPTFPLSFPDPPLAPLPVPTTSNAAPTRFQLPTTPIDPQTHLRHLLACSGAAWWATRFAICDILTPRARRQLFLAQDMLIATSTSSTNALGTVCMAVVSEHEAARQALMAQLARSARVERMLPVLDVVMPPAAAHLPSGAGGGVGTGVREAVVVVPLSVMGSVADRVRVRRLAPNEAKTLLGVVVAAMAKLARVGVGYRGFKLDYVLINGHIPDTQDLTPVDMLVGGYHAMFDTPLPSSPKSPSTPASSSVNSDVVTPDAARAIADLLTAVGKAMDPTRVHEAFAGLLSAGPPTHAAANVMPGAWAQAPPQVQVKDPSVVAPVAHQQQGASGGELTWSQLLKDLAPVVSAASI